MSSEIHLIIKLGAVGFIFIAFIIFAVKLTVRINIEIDEGSPGKSKTIRIETKGISDDIDKIMSATINDLENKLT